MAIANQVIFDNQVFEIISHNNRPYVAMKSFVQNIGLSWQSQQQKLQKRFHSVITILEITAKDGKKYKALCLPLDKLTTWLLTIHANKVKPEIRPLILRYQAESEAALFQYWTTGIAKQSEIRAELYALQQQEQQSFHQGSQAGKSLYIRKLEKQRNAALLNSLQMQLDFLNQQA